MASPSLGGAATHDVDAVDEDIKGAILASLVAVSRFNFNNRNSIHNGLNSRKSFIGLAGEAPGLGIRIVKDIRTWVPSLFWFCWPILTAPSMAAFISGL